MIRISERGTADILEEIPSILVVIVATFLFLMTATDTIITHSEFRSERLLADELSSFCDSILSHEPLLFDSTYGQLDSRKLTEKGRTEFEDHYDTQLLGFHYNITVIDVSLYERIYFWTAGEDPDLSSTRVQSLVPATVCNELGEHHSVILRIVIWK